MVSLLSSKAHSLSNLTAARRNRLRRALLETFEQRCLMAADLGLLESDQFSSGQFSSELGAQSQALRPLQFIQANLNEAALSDAASFLGGTLGSSAGGLTSQPWFPLVNSAYDRWTAQQGLAFSLSTAQADIASGLAAEGEGLVAEGEAGGPRLLSIAPNSGEIFSFNNLNTLTEAPTELVFRFDRAIDPSTIQSGISVTRSGSPDELSGTVLMGDSPLIAIMRFPQTLPDDTYRVEVKGDADAGAIKDSVSGKTLQPRLSTTSKDTVNFNLELGAQVVAVVPQPVDRNTDGSLAPQLNKIRVYFNNDDLDQATATDPSFYQLIYTGDSIQPHDDKRFTPQSVVYNPLEDLATLTFASRIDQLAGPGTYRLRVGSNVVVNSISNLPAVSVISPSPDPSGYFADAKSLDAELATGSVRVTQDLVNVGNPLPIDLMGSDLDPGSRDINPKKSGDADNHNYGRTGDNSQFIDKRTFSFSLNVAYGNDAQGRPVFTTITPDQMARVREVFEFYSQQLGIDFAEVDGSGADYRVVVGDLNPVGGVSGPGGEGGLGGGSLAVMDGAENWDNTFGGGFFGTTMHEVGHLLGLGHTYDLPPGTIMGDYTGVPQDGTPSGPLTDGAQQFPGNNDVIHGQFIYRPDNKDVDLYTFKVGAGQTKNLRVETIAERLADSSDADTVVTLYKKTSSGLVVLASNNDYFSSDSFLTLDIEGGASGTEYYLAVTTAGNQDFNPAVSNSGSGGVSQGRYQLLVDLVDETNASIVDTSGSALDGDGDGLAGGDFNFWFRTAAPAGTAAAGEPKIVFVDKSYTGTAPNGSPSRPFNSLTSALAAVTSNDILRIVGNLGADGLLNTVADTQAYEIGRGGPGNAILSDGLAFQVPQGVTAMIDAGAVFKLRGSRITAGSLDTGTNNSFSSIQVLGTPAQSVYFTSYDDQSIGVDTNPIGTSPQAGNWGGIEIHNDVDRAQGRGDYERRGIFLNYIAHASMQYGGGQVTVSNPSPTLNPIYLAESRPTLLYNRISSSADAAISADPDSFEETRFTEPRYQLPTSSTDHGYRPDYDRVGPDIRGNTLKGNSVNGLFLRVPTAPGQELVSLNVAARLDDTDITYVLGENLIIGGTPGGPVVENQGPSVSLLQGIPGTGGRLAAGTYEYKLTFVDRFGAESVPSNGVSLAVASNNSSLLLNNLPAATGTFVGRRVWRKGPGESIFTLVAEIDRTGTSYRDVGGNLGVVSTLPSAPLQRARRDARLAIDPGVVIKSLGSRIEVGVGGQLIAEGTAARPIIFTSKLDDRFGAGGTLDTNADGSATGPQAGDWGGLVARHLSQLSIDHAVIAYGGGATSVPGGFAAFNAVEIHQAEARVAHSVFEHNSNGYDSTQGLQLTRGGHGTNAPGVIYVAASQPVIIDNVMRNNLGAAINIDADSMKAVSVQDGGRQTGAIDARPGGLGNLGPLVRGNQLTGQRIGNGPEVINGMEVRGGTLTTEAVWDDTDIVHVLRQEIYVPNFHHVGGLRLVSHVDESLVVKLATSAAGFTAGGRGLEITDRIGGSVQIEGAPGFPVVLTSLKDDTVGAGFDPAGKPQIDTNGDGNSAGQAGDWRGIKLEARSNDRNVATVPELESDKIQDRGTNDIPVAAQPLGGLAAGLGQGDENLRLGFVVDGAIASPKDLDVYSFVGVAGTQVWIDIDRTGASLDSVVELINEAGVVIAQSDNSLAESVAVASGAAGVPYQTSNPALIAPNRTQVLDSDPFAPKNSWTPGVARDFGSSNPLDAGLRVQLPGTAGTTNTYLVRVRSSNLKPGDPATQLQDPSKVEAGLTTGAYRLQLRLQQTDEVAGSSIHYADVRYATNGVEALATPVHSPLLGDNAVGLGAGMLDLGDLGRSDRGALTAAGQLGLGADVRWFQFDVHRKDVQIINKPGEPAVTDVATHVSTIFDIDYADGYGGPNTSIWVFDSTGKLVYIGTDSNIADDRGAPGQGTDLDDLTRGSAGSRDAFIGAQALPTGRYMLAVTNNSQVASALSQFQQAAGTTSTRLEPIDSVRRVAEDRFETSAPGRASTFEGPMQVAFNATQGSLKSENLVPFTVGDLVSYYATSAGFLGNVNALTGVREETISDGRRTLSTMAMGPDGTVVAYALPVGAISDGNAGQFVTLSRTGNSPAAFLGTSGLQTFAAEQTDTATPPTFAIRQRGGDGDGIVFRGLTFWLNDQSGGTSMIGVGSRSDTSPFYEDLVDVLPLPPDGPDGVPEGVSTINTNTTNIVYSLTTSGVARDALASPWPARTGSNVTDGAGTNRIEMGRFLTSGTITGLAQIGSQLYAVSNRGELFSTSVGADGDTYFGSRLPTTTLFDGATAIAFTSLAAAPKNLVDSDNNSLANVLFGTTNDGTIYAFSTNGALQRIFPGGLYKTHSSTSPSDIRGLAFSPLSTNLWHISERHGNDAGHGYPATYDRSRPDAESNAHKYALYFGFERTGNTPVEGTWAPQYDALNGTYNFPGGAKGAVESKPIDLSGYSADDLPTLYFNYLLASQNKNADLSSDENYMLDSFRVYATADGTDWKLLATNNTPNDQDFANGEDEADYSYRDAFGNRSMVQELFDTPAGNQASWRQARVNLAPLAGQQNVRLRFEFASGGTFNTGDALRGGVELSAVPAWQLVDGQAFRVTTNDMPTFASRQFEFDFGLMLNLPAGASIPLGSTIRIHNRTYTFDTTPGTDKLVVLATDTAEQVAIKVRAKLVSDGYSQAYVNAVRPNVLILPTNATTVPAGGTYQTTGISATDVIIGRPGVAAASVSIPVMADVANYTLATTAVRDSIRQALAGAFSNNNTRAWSVYGQTIRMFKYDVVNVTLPGVEVTHPLGITAQNARTGDNFGVKNNGGNDVGFGVTERELANNFEGVYIDDIIVGFAERGEQVINAPTGTSFTPNREFEPEGFNVNEIEQGHFQLEIRTAMDYGVSVKHDSTPGAPMDYSLRDTIDTNDRAASGIAVQVLAGSAIPDGSTFTLADDTNIATFEFDVLSGPNDTRAGATPGNVVISIASNWTAAQVAVAVRDAINSAAARTLLSLSASLQGEMRGSSTEVASNSDTLILHGPAKFTRTGNFLTTGSLNSVTVYGQDSAGWEETGDRNRGRVDQGQLLISASSFSFASQWGVKLDDTNNPTSPRNLPPQDPNQYVPGTVLVNNIFNGNNAGGVTVVGSTRPIADKPVVRILNNTFYGSKAGDSGVSVNGGAAPSVLNNIFANLSTAVSGSGATVGANIFKDNANNGTAGSFAIVLGVNDPLFVSPTSQNFYLAAGAKAIDSSLEALPERQELSEVRNALALPPSPLLAPDRDIFGQRRVDDPTVSTPAGLGANVFKDRGATDRSDFAALQATLLQPQDNDSSNVDIDRNISFLRLNDGLLDYFSILLQDGEGIGPDAATVVPEAIALTENGRLLEPGVDYVFGYNANSRTVRLTPLAGIWRSDSVYEISLSNRNGHRITLGAGAGVANGDTITVTMPDNTTRVLTLSSSASGGSNIPFSVNDTPYQIAVQVVDRINAIGGGVSAYLQGSGAVMVVGAVNVQSSKPAAATITSVGAVRDLAGNALAPNRANSQTQFTIVMPDVQLDYGDAAGPFSFATPPSDSTWQSSDGARHALLPIDVARLELGRLVDADNDGSPSKSATGDDNEAGIDLSTLGSIAGITVGARGPATYTVRYTPTATLDGITLKIVDPALKATVFELTTDGTVGVGNLPVAVTVNDTSSEIATKLAAAVKLALLSGRISGVAPVADGAEVNFGGTAQHTFEVSNATVLERRSVSSFDLTVPANAPTTIADGQTFTIHDGNGQSLTFEINDMSPPGPATPVAASHVEVQVDRSTATATSIAQAIGAAINAEIDGRRLSLAPVVVDGSTISIATDDEDGVSFGGLFNAKSLAVPVTVTSTGTGMLDAWFDWNRDGDFNDAGEQMVVNKPVMAGANVFNIQTPSTALVGFTTARFRLSTLGSLLPTGVGIGGEVEDHLIEVVDGTPPVAVTDSYEVDEDGVLTVPAKGILTNDTDAEGDALTVVDLDPVAPNVQTSTSTANGTLVLHADGSFTYNPNADFFGTDTFVYQAMDLRLASNLLATVTINVKPINDAPKAFDDTITISEDETIVRDQADFLNNDWKHYLGSVTNENGQLLTLVSAALLAPNTGSVSVANNQLTYTPAANYTSAINGPVLVELTIGDSGEAGGDDNPLTSKSTLTINITPVNDRPEFTMPATTSTAEDAGLVTTPFITGIRPGPIGAADEAGGPALTPENQTVSFQVRALDPSLFAVQPTVAANGTLSYQLAPDVNEVLADASNPGFPLILVEVIAVDTGASTAPDLNTSLPVTFTILPDAVNDAPEFTIPTTATATEDAGVVTIAGFMTDIRKGTATALDETNQTLTVSIGASAAAFTTLPTIDLTNGNLSFQTGPDVNNLTGHNLVVTVTLTDSGDGVSPNVNSTTKTFTLSITPINDEPLFTLPAASVTVFEDNEAFIGASKTQIVGFATGVAVGPATAVDELATQTRVFQTVSVSDPSLFSVQPTLTANGMLEFATATDKNGQATVVVRLTDDGSATAPDDNVSLDQTFTIIVQSVNDAPEIVVPTVTPASREDQGLVVVPAFATSLRNGTVTATDEATQTYTVHVTAADPTAFVIQPTIAADGTLRYQAQPNVNSAFRDLSVTVYLTDDGTTGPLPDTNQSASHTFTIAITPVNDAPDFVLSQSTVTVNEDVEAAQVPPAAKTEVPGFATNIVTGPDTAGDEATQSVSFDVINVSAPELFSIQPTISSDGTLSFKTAANKNGKAVVIVRLVDSGDSVAPNDNDSERKTFTISITPINDAPLFDLPAGLTIDEDSGVITRSGFATNVRRGPAGADDESSQTIAFHVIAVDPSAFEIQPEIAADGTLTFKTAANVNSANSNLAVRVYLTDNGVGAPAPNTNTSVEKTFSITVNAVNDAPVADRLSMDSTEDVQFEIQASTVLAGDSAGPTSDEASQSLSITQVERTTALGGTVTPIFSGSVITSLIYRPAVNAVGVDTFLYVVSDNGVPSRSGTGTISIALAAVNDPPQFTIGVDQTVIEDSATVSVPNWATNILAGPPSAIDEPLTQTVYFVVAVNNPALFEVQPTVSGDGTLSFKPAKDAVGTAVVNLYAQDTGSNVPPNANRSATGSFSITITPVNDAPVFTAGGSIAVNEDSGQFGQAWATGIAPAGGLLSQPATATDESAQVIDFILTPNKPELFAVAPTIDASGVLKFTPAQNAYGVALISVVAKDRGPAGANDQNTSVAQTLTVTINAQNDAPSAGVDTLSADENNVLTVSAPGLLANDSDVDLPADQISAIAATVTSTLGATVTIHADGSVVYDPRGVTAIQRLSSGQSEADSFTYQVRDLAGATSALTTVTVIVQGFDDAPVANNDAFTVPVGQAINLDVLRNDTDADSQIDFRTIVLTALPAFGTATVNQTGVVNYAPGVGFRGTDTFSYVVRDVGGNLSNEATVTLTVNNAPRASNDNAFTVKNKPVVIDVAGNDVDPDGSINPTTVEIVVQPAPSGVATVRSDGKIEFTPATGFSGPVRLSYFVRDDVGSPSNVADVSIEVLPSLWQNPTLALDVNDDGEISPIDALLIINYLNSGAPSQLPSNQGVPPYLDPSGDEFASARDVLLIINYLNAHPSGEGESTVSEQLVAPMIVTMVTPEQMVATVGPQVVREVEAALAAELELCEPWQSEASSDLVTDLAEQLWGEEASAAALTELAIDREHRHDADDVDQYFGTL